MISKHTSFHSVHEIQVDAACEEPVDLRARRVHPPWLRAAHMTLRVGGVLFVLAVILFTAVVAEKLELMNHANVSSEKR